MRIRLGIHLLISLFILMIAAQAQAIILVDGDDQTINLELLGLGTTPSNPSVDDLGAWIPGWTTGDPLFELYKDNVGGSEEGGFAGSYETTFSGDLSGFTITFEVPPPITGQSYLLVKDGSIIPTWYFYDLTQLGWNGIDDIVGINYWNESPSNPLGNGAISHVSIYGGRASVPEPATMLLFGTGLVGLAGARIRRKKV